MRLLKKILIFNHIMFFNINLFASSLQSDSNLLTEIVGEFQEIQTDHNRLIHDLLGQNEIQAHLFKQLLSRVQHLYTKLGDIRELGAPDDEDDMTLDFYQIPNDNEGNDFSFNYLFSINTSTALIHQGNINTFLTLLSSVILFNTALVTQIHEISEGSEKLDRAYRLYSLNMSILSNIRINRRNHVLMVNTLKLASLHKMREIKIFSNMHVLAWEICEYFYSFLQPKVIKSVIFNTLA